MPYGVRVRMNGRAAGIPFGVKIEVCRRTPSRIGIIASVESNAEPAGACAGACAGAARPAEAAMTRRRPRRPLRNGLIGWLSLSRPPGGMVGDRLPRVPDPPLAL